ncbi:hypothetical protein DBB33_10040 [Chromobacterium haemolyticum]|nr:hypothetical protein B0T40_09290 [Chromobacterium haemolyticum]OQS43337.1 hypothetical protein B0T39_03700 [Chromobacterium haemolyticum]PTU69751.1 hypothetical protein DBB33_10040 [Chromobacterium haemolyticum]
MPRPPSVTRAIAPILLLLLILASLLQSAYPMLRGCALIALLLFLACASLSHTRTAIHTGVFHDYRSRTNILRQDRSFRFWLHVSISLILGIGALAAAVALLARLFSSA